MPFLDFVNDGANDVGEINEVLGPLLGSFSPESDPADTLLSPVRANESQLADLSDTYIIAGLQDPLLQQALRYQRALQAAGVTTHPKTYDTNHGYTNEKITSDGERVNVTDMRTLRAAEEYRVALLQHIFYQTPMPKL
jgi:acetyl esterase/lipase